MPELVSSFELSVVPLLLINANEPNGTRSLIEKSIADNPFHPIFFPRAFPYLFFERPHTYLFAYETNDSFPYVYLDAPPPYSGVLLERHTTQNVPALRAYMQSLAPQ